MNQRDETLLKLIWNLPQVILLSPKKSKVCYSAYPISYHLYNKHIHVHKQCNTDMYLFICTNICTFMYIYSYMYIYIYIINCLYVSVCICICISNRIQNKLVTLVLFFLEEDFTFWTEQKHRTYHCVIFWVHFEFCNTHSIRYAKIKNV